MGWLFYINKCVILAKLLLLLRDKQFVITQYPILQLFLDQNQLRTTIDIMRLLKSILEARHETNSHRRQMHKRSKYRSITIHTVMNLSQ